MFQNFPTDAKVWIYAVPQAISQASIEEIKNKLNGFLLSWNAHGAALIADYAIVENHFIILAVNETQAKASGCSIDSSVKIMRDISTLIKQDVLERALVYYQNESDGAIKNIHFSKLEQALSTSLLNENTLIYDNTIHTLEQLRTQWKTQLKNTWMKNYLTSTI